MEQIILTLVIIAIISNIIANQIDPLEWIKNKLGIGYKREIYSRYKFIDLILYTIHKLINCNSCLSFWITIIYYWSIEGIFYGFISYALSALFYNYVFSTKINF